MARQRYCRRLARSCNTLRVSADRVAKPAAHSRAESRGSRPSKAARGEKRTHRWTKRDSNRLSPVRLPQPKSAVGGGDTPDPKNRLFRRRALTQQGVFGAYSFAISV